MYVCSPEVDHKNFVPIGIVCVMIKSYPRQMIIIFLGSANIAIRLSAQLICICLYRIINTDLYYLQICKSGTRESSESKY